MGRLRDEDDRRLAEAYEEGGQHAAAEQLRDRIRGREYQRLVGDGEVRVDLYRPRTKCAGPSDRVRHGRMQTADEARFIAEKRRAGVSDPAIATMMNVPIAHLSLEVEPVTAAQVDEERQARAYRDRMADRLQRAFERDVEREVDRERRARLRGSSRGSE